MDKNEDDDYQFDEYSLPHNLSIGPFAQLNQNTKLKCYGGSTSSAFPNNDYIAYLHTHGIRFISIDKQNRYDIHYTQILKMRTFEHKVWDSHVLAIEYWADDLGMVVSDYFKGELDELVIFAKKAVEEFDHSAKTIGRETKAKVPEVAKPAGCSGAASLLLFGLIAFLMAVVAM